MFEHEYLDLYDYDHIPLGRDCYLMDEKFMKEYKQYCLQLFDGVTPEHVGYISHIAVKKINNHSLELSWYPTYERYHEVAITLPKDQLITCVGCWRYDEKPHLFVKSEWLKYLYLKQYSIFAMIDAIDVKKAIKNGNLSKQSLINLREEIDKLGDNNPDIIFISFADSLLLKSNWTVGTFEDEVNYTYNPEKFLTIFQEIQSIYKQQLGLNVYGIFTQGSNEYYDDTLIHISKKQNHICLNSLGAPFANLHEIERTVRCFIKNETHPRSEIYMDKDFYQSLKFKYNFERDITKQEYVSNIGDEKRVYYYTSCQFIIDNLK